MSPPLHVFEQALAESENDRISHYAVGCIQNIERTNHREGIVRERETAAGAAGTAIESH